MTDKVLPSFGRVARSREFSAALAYGGGSGEGIVWPSSSRLVEGSEGDLDTGALGAFNHVSSSGLDVTFDTGEGVVRGAYLARDTQTTYTLPSSSTTTIYLGWKDGQADTIIIGESSDFGSHDPKLAIWTFTTDSTSVTGTTDERPMADAGYISAGSIKRGANIIDDGSGFLAVSQGQGSGLNADHLRGYTAAQVRPDQTQNAGGSGGYSRVASNSGDDPLTKYTFDYDQTSDGIRVNFNAADSDFSWEVYAEDSSGNTLVNDSGSESSSSSTTVEYNYSEQPAVYAEATLSDNNTGTATVAIDGHLVTVPTHNHSISTL